MYRRKTKEYGNIPDKLSYVCSILSLEVNPGGGALLGPINPGGAEIWDLETAKKTYIISSETQSYMIRMIRV